MTVEALLADLFTRKVRLWPSGDLIEYEAPEGAISDDLLAEVRSHKPELLEALRSRCSRCLELDALGVRVLACPVCSHRLLPPEQPSPDALWFPLFHRAQDRGQLLESQQIRWRYCVLRFLKLGWSREDAELAAFRRVVRLPGQGSNESAAQLHLAPTEAGDG